MTNSSTKAFLRSEVPDFLRSSDFYLSLDDAEDEPITIPSKCARFNLKLNRHDFEDELRSLLATFRFWGIYSLLDIAEFTSFVLAVPNKLLCRTVLAEFEAELAELSILIKILEETSEERALCMVICLGKFELVKTMAANNYVFSEACLFAAARHNQVDCLELALSKGCAWNPSALSIAATQGHVQILKFAHENGLECGDNVCADAAKAGQLACLQYAYENGHKWEKKFVPVHNLAIALYARSIGAEWVDFSCCDAAKLGSIEVLKYFHEGRDYDYPISNKALLVAVWMGHTDCVRCLRSIGVAWTGCECELAAYRGHLDTLKYLCECGCPCDVLTSWVCAVHDRVDCLQYLHENGCPWDYATPIDCTHQRTDSIRACPHCEYAYIEALSHTDQTYKGLIDEIERLGEFWYRRTLGMPHTRPRIRITPDLLATHRQHDDTVTFGINALCNYYKATQCQQYAHSQEHNVDTVLLCAQNFFTFYKAYTT